MENNYDETFTEKEIELIDELITLSLKKGEFVSEEEINRELKTN